MKNVLFLITVPYQIIAWATVIGTIAGAVAAIVLVCKSWKYIRAIYKRCRLIGRLKRICRRDGYKFEILSSCYKSVFKVTDEPEIMITTPETKYSVKLFTCLRYKDTYTLNNATHFTTQSNGKMHLVDFGYPESGIAKNELYMSHFPTIGDEVITEKTLEGDSTSNESREVFGATKILCLNPISVEVRKVAGSTTEQVFDGDKIDGHTVYSGDALCRAIA